MSRILWTENLVLNSTLSLDMPLLGLEALSPASKIQGTTPSYKNGM